MYPGSNRRCGPEEVELNAVDSAESSLVEQVLESGDGRIEAVLLHNEEPAVLARQRLGAFRKYIACSDERTDVADVLRVPGRDLSAPDNREGKIRARWLTGFHIRHCWLHRVG